MTIRLKKLYISLGVAATMSISACSSLAGRELTCQDLRYGNPAYEANMAELARQAQLPDNHWNRYHADAVADMCANNTKALDVLTGDGEISAAEISRIATVLKKHYKPKARSGADVQYGEVREKLLKMGACSACADNIARYYVEKPHSQCTELAKRALSGDPESTEKMLEWPPYCRWAY